MVSKYPSRVFLLRSFEFNSGPGLATHPSTNRPPKHRRGNTNLEEVGFDLSEGHLLSLPKGWDWDLLHRPGASLESMTLRAAL